MFVWLDLDADSAAETTHKILVDGGAPTEISGSNCMFLVYYYFVVLFH